MGISNWDSQEFEALGFSRSEFDRLCERCQTSFVNPRLNVPVSNTLQVDHCRCDIAVSHPLLQRANVNSVLQVARRVCVAEFVKEPTSAVLSFGAAIDLDSPVLQFPSRDAATAIQFCPIRDPF
jgi:hypothetical protein